MIPSFLNRGVVDLENFQPEDFDLRTAVTCLSRINRFSGHTAWPYSVAQHAVIVSYLVPEWATAVALHHDTTEAYVGDCPGPIKGHLPFFKGLEAKIEGVIFEALGIPLTSDARAVVANADKWALRLEQINLQGRSEFFDFEPTFTPDPKADLATALDILDQEMTPTQAYRLFMLRHWKVVVGK